MFSMAAASLFLPFLPMLPSQILLDDFLYDVSQATIPSDNVDAAMWMPSGLDRPRLCAVPLVTSRKASITRLCLDLSKKSRTHEVNHVSDGRFAK